METSKVQELRNLLKMVRIKESAQVCNKSANSIVGYRSNNPKRWPNERVAVDLIPRLKEYLVMKNKITIGEGGLVEKVEQQDETGFNKTIYTLADKLIQIQNRMTIIDAQLRDLEVERMDLGIKESKFKSILEGLRELKSSLNL